MEAIAIVGLVASCGTIVQYSARAVRGLHNLRRRFRHVEDRIDKVIIQTQSISAAVGRISEWLETNPPNLGELGPTLRKTLESCQISIQSMMREMEGDGGKNNRLRTPQL